MSVASKKEPIFAQYCNYSVVTGDEVEFHCWWVTNIHSGKPECVMLTACDPTG